MLSNDFKCKNFNFGQRYFHLHGGKLKKNTRFYLQLIMFHVALDMICVELGMTIDCETPNPEGLPEEIVQDYDNIKIEILAFQTKWSDKTRTLQDTYPVPVLNYNGVKYEKT